MSSPDNVLLLAHRLDLGGSERQMTEIAKALDRRYFHPHIACFHPAGIRAEELRAAGIPILHLPVTSFASPSALRGGWKLIRYIREHNIRIVHSFDVPLNIFAVPFAKLAHGPVVLSSQRAHRDLTPGVYTKLLRVTDQLVDGIVVNCLYMRDHLAQDEHVGADLIHLCYNGIDFSTFHREGRAAADLTVGVVCALRPEKGLLSLIRGFAEAARHHSQSKLVIVGSGPMLSTLEEEVARLAIGHQCTFVPKTNDVAHWMRQIDIFVLPSLTEALSNSLMEAMACGCCPVASDVGGNPELVGRDGTRGMLFPKEDSHALGSLLDLLLGNTEIRAQIAGAGYQFMHQEFSLEQSARRMERIYRSFL